MCPDGFDGFNCENDRSQKFLGNYTVAQKLSPTAPESYATSIERSSKRMRFAIKNMNNYFPVIPAEFYHDTLMINADINYEQKVIGIGVMEQGGDSVLKMYYKVVDLSSKTLQDFGYENADNVVSWRK